MKFKKFFLIITVAAMAASFSPANGMERKIEQLKTFIVESLQNETQKQVAHAKNCPICLENFKDEEQLYILNCNPHAPHIFHKDCLEVWAQHHRICPLCRAPIIAANLIKHNSQVLPRNREELQIFYQQNFHVILSLLSTVLLEGILIKRKVNFLPHLLITFFTIYFCYKIFNSTGTLNQHILSLFKITIIIGLAEYIFHSWADQ